MGVGRVTPGLSRAYPRRIEAMQIATFLTLWMVTVPAQAGAGGSWWTPRGEAEAMAERPLAGGKIAFKPGSGVAIGTADGRWSLRVSAWAQLRLTVDHQQRPASGAANPSAALEFNRARLVVAGNAFTKHVQYMVHLMFAPKDLGFKDGVATRAPIFMWYTTYTRLKNLQVQAGFFFVPHARQRLQPAALLQMADNSSASYEFTLNQDMGVQVSSPDIAGLGRMRYYAGVFMGEGYEWYRPSDLGLTYMGRFEVLPLGLFADQGEADFERAPRPKLSLGAAYAFADRDRRTRAISGGGFADGGSMSAHNFTADVVFKWSGLSVLADFYVREGWRHAGGLKDPMGAAIATQAARNGYGWTGQFGVLLPRTRVEAVGRASGMRALKSVASSLARLDEVGAGLNYYFFRHALKLQADYIHSWGPALPLGRGDQLRLQLQLVF